MPPSQLLQKKEEEEVPPCIIPLGLFVEMFTSNMATTGSNPTIVCLNPKRRCVRVYRRISNPDSVIATYLAVCGTDYIVMASDDQTQLQQNDGQIITEVPIVYANTDSAPLLPFRSLMISKLSIHQNN